MLHMNVVSQWIFFISKMCSPCGPEWDQFHSNSNIECFWEIKRKKKKLIDWLSFAVGCGCSFSLQPVRDTGEKQIQLWKDLILDYCKSQKIFVVFQKNIMFYFLNYLVVFTDIWLLMKAKTRGCGCGWSLNEVNRVFLLP